MGTASSREDAPPPRKQPPPVVQSNNVPPATQPITPYVPPPAAADDVMQLSIRTWANHTILVSDIRPTDSVAELKRKAAAQAGLDIADGSLVYAGKSLDEHRTVADYDIMKGSTLHWVKKTNGSSSAPTSATAATATTATTVVSPHVHVHHHYHASNPPVVDANAAAAASVPPPVGEPTQIFVKTYTGKTLTFDVMTNDPLRTVKILIETETQITPVDQRLIFGGRQLDDNLTLQDYSIQRESTIHLARPINNTPMPQ